jgi:L-alanine-DL-glutamate epimerase-like enolase superfamily enzyme
VNEVELRALVTSLRAEAAAASDRVKAARQGADAMKAHGQRLAYIDAADRLEALL